MAKKLVNPVYSVYKLTFSSGKTYIGYHKQTKENDTYITSSSYYKNNPKDIIVSREILIETFDDFAASFLETWCILSDKAYNGRNNVNKNLGNFYHRFSYGFLTEEQKRTARERFFDSVAKRSEEDIKRIKRNMSNGQKRRFKENPMSEDARNNLSEKRKQYFASLSEERMSSFKEKVSKATKQRMNSMTAEEKNIYLHNAHESQKKRVLCVETGVIYDSIKDAMAFLGLTGSVRRSANDPTGKRTVGGFHWRWL